MTKAELLAENKKLKEDLQAAHCLIERQQDELYDRASNGLTLDDIHDLIETNQFLDEKLDNYEVGTKQRAVDKAKLWKEATELAKQYRSDGFGVAVSRQKACDDLNITAGERQQRKKIPMK